MNQPAQTESQHAATDPRRVTFESGSDALEQVLEGIIAVPES